MISKEQLEEERKRPDVLRSCYNCEWLVGYVSLWCTNEDARKDRGTAIPGCIHCPHWDADKEAQRTIDYNRKIESFMIVD